MIGYEVETIDFGWRRAPRILLTHNQVLEFSIFLGRKNQIAMGEHNIVITVQKVNRRGPYSKFRV